jgi:hypothetical protein
VEVLLRIEFLVLLVQAKRTKKKRLMRMEITNPAVRVSRMTYRYPTSPEVNPFRVCMQIFPLVPQVSPEAINSLTASLSVLDLR